MECPREEEVLSAFVDGETPVSRQRALARHVVNCEKCAAQTGRLLAVRAYLDAEPEETASLSTEFWQRLSQALRLADLVAHTQAQPKRRSLWQPLHQPHAALVAGAAVLLIALTIGLAWHSPVPPLQPAALAQAHESALAQAPAPAFASDSFPGGATLASLHDSALAPPLAPLLPQSSSPVQPAAWGTGLDIGDGGMWIPEVQRGEHKQSASVDHEVYSGSPVPVSRFTVPEGALDTRQMKPVRIGTHEYYAAREGATTILARRAQGQWRLLVADAPLQALITFAELHPDDLDR